jgi:uncharacterized membrane protein
MQLIESYLSEIARFLPAGQRADILSELRSSLEEQVLDLAGDNAPGLDEQKSVINRLGHPMSVASGYQSHRYLIGPELFPTFVQTLKIVLVVVAAIQLAIMMIAYVTSGWTTSVIGMFTGVFDTLLWASLIVTIVFASIEYSGHRLDWYDKWSANSLSLSTGSSIDRGSLISDLVSEGVFLLWWNDVLVLQNWIPGAREIFTVTLGDAWGPLYVPLNILFGAWFLLHSYVLIRALWQPITLYAEMILGAVCIGIGVWLLAHRPLLSVSGDIGANGELIIDRVAMTVVAGVILLTVWEFGKAVRRLMNVRLYTAGDAK